MKFFSINKKKFFPSNLNTDLFSLNNFEKTFLISRIAYEDSFWVLGLLFNQWQKCSSS